MSTTRRHFLQASALAGLASQTTSAQPRRISPNDHVNVATIGIGIQGSNDTQSSLLADGVKLVAVSDIYEGRLIGAKEKHGADVFTARDYREVLARPDVDAVIIATPDHWHQKIAIDAMAAGKDVYLEKPMVQHLDDGQPLIDAWHKSDRILQVGSQRVSSIVYKKAQDLLRQGAIGELNMVEAWWDRNSAIGAWQYSIPTDASPATVDWDRFLGRAPKRPFDATRAFRWRNYRDYGTGVAGDLFVHLFSGMHFILGATGPDRVYSTGGTYFWKDGRDVPDLMMGLYDYGKTEHHPAFTLSLRVNFEDGANENYGFSFIGSDGVLSIGNGVTVTKRPRPTEPGFTIDSFSKAQQQAYMQQYRAKYPKPNMNADSMRPVSEDKYLPPPGYNDHVDHHRNFIHAVRTRQPVVEDPVFGLRAAGPALLSNVSYFEQRVCRWDAAAMREKA